MESELSATMQKALAFAKRNNGVLTRHPGGFWAHENLNPHGENYGTPTIEGLVKRGKMTYTKWQERDPRPAFPIEATITA